MKKFHQEYASGASPPGPGQISFNEFRISSVNSMVKERKLSVNCSIVRGPIIGDVTSGLDKSQASAREPGF
jgi:hypothetical protein